ncbi:MAG: regulator [Verrucomicrobia bacterium]|nr:regulator [Verrucomicrobiota bacterium]
MNTTAASSVAATPIRPRLWVSGDWNAFFGFGTNILVNLLTLTALLRFVLGFPDELVFGRILPAVGLMLCLSTGYYAWLAYDLARKTGRSDVCALPSGPGVGHMFIVVFAVMLPIKLQTGDPVKAWEAGLTWVVIQSFVLMLGGFIGPWVRRVTPRAALLGTLAGVSITFISMRPALQMLLTPVIGLVCFAILLVNWFGGVRFFRGLPAGLVALLTGTVIAWGSTYFDLNYGGLSLAGLGAAFSRFGFSLPLPVIGHVFSGFEFLGLLLVTAIPFGLYDLIEALDNVESAAVAGDSFPTTRVLCADGAVSLIGAIVGCPFMLAVYIGHPGWKAMGGRIGYSLATGGMVIVLCWLGIVPALLALVPVVAILPILLYIGMLIGSQAFQETPHRHAPAVILAMVPHLAAWALGQVNGALAAAGAARTPELVANLENQGVLLHGLEILGGGAALSGIVFAAITVFVIEHKLRHAAAFAIAGALFTLFGLMHGERVGLTPHPGVAVGYLLVAAFLAVCDRYSPRGERSEPQHNQD